MTQLTAQTTAFPGARLTTVQGPPCPVVIGRHLCGEIARLAGEHASRVALVHPPAAVPAARRISAGLAERGRTAVPVVIPPGGDARSAGVLVYLWSRLADAGFTARDAVVGLGDRPVTDVAAFTAATFRHGLRLVVVPTTTAAMARAALDGRTGIDIEQGRDLVGAVHLPRGLVCDLELLAGESPGDRAAGLAEVIRTGFTADPVILDLLASGTREALAPAGPLLRELIERTVRARAGAIPPDPAGLDYGDAFAQAAGHGRHRAGTGHALSAGMVFAAELARLAGRLAPHTVQRHRTLLESAGLPVTWHRGDWPRLKTALLSNPDTARHPDAAGCADAAVRRNGTGSGTGEPGVSGGRFVILDGPGRPALLEAPSETLLAAAFDAVST